MDSVSVRLRKITYEQQQQRQIEEIQRIFNIGFEHVKGPTAWFNARRIAPLVNSSLAAIMRQKVELANDIWKRKDLARREVDILYDGKNTSTESLLAYRKAKDRLKQLRQLDGWIGNGFLFSQNALAELIQQADDGRKSVDYDGEKAKLAARKFNDAVSDQGDTNDYAVITERSTNPETIAIEKDIRRIFGVKVNFSDNSTLAQQTLEVCEKVASLGHKLPDEIIFGESSEDKSCSGLTVNQSDWKYIVIANSDQQYQSIVSHGLRIVVDNSLKGTLYHEFGHINAKTCFHSPELEEFSEKFRDQLSSVAKEITLARRKMDELRDATGQGNTLEEIMFPKEPESPEKPKSKDNPTPILSKMEAFLDGLPDSLGKKVAQEVSLYAASSPDEFVAEVYCGCMLGKVYDEEIMDEYKRLGGVPFE
jgi:hypothetical protein